MGTNWGNEPEQQRAAAEGEARIAKDLGRPAGSVVGSGIDGHAEQYIDHSGTGPFCPGAGGQRSMSKWPELLINSRASAIISPSFWCAARLPRCRRGWS
jgi:hypothetical protein